MADDSRGPFERGNPNGHAVSVIIDHVGDTDRIPLVRDYSDMPKAFGIFRERDYVTGLPLLEASRRFVQDRAKHDSIPFEIRIEYPDPPEIDRGSSTVRICTRMFFYVA